MMEQELPPSRELRRAYPALSRFLMGYLHEDYRLEHGSSRRAAEAFAKDAAAPEREAATNELERLLERYGESEEVWRGAVSALGAAWRPRALASIETVLGIIRPEPEHNR